MRGDPIVRGAKGGGQRQHAVIRANRVVVGLADDAELALAGAACRRHRIDADRDRADRHGQLQRADDGEGINRHNRHRDGHGRIIVADADAHRRARRLVKRRIHRQFPATFVDRDIAVLRANERILIVNAARAAAGQRRRGKYHRRRVFYQQRHHRRRRGQRQRANHIDRDRHRRGGKSVFRLDYHRVFAKRVKRRIQNQLVIRNRIKRRVRRRNRPGQRVGIGADAAFHLRRPHRPDMVYRHRRHPFFFAARAKLHPTHNADRQRQRRRRHAVIRDDARHRQTDLGKRHSDADLARRRVNRVSSRFRIIDRRDRVRISACPAARLRRGVDHRCGADRNRCVRLGRVELHRRKGHYRQRQRRL